MSRREDDIIYCARDLNISFESNTFKQLLAEFNFSSSAIAAAKIIAVIQYLPPLKQKDTQLFAILLSSLSDEKYDQIICQAIINEVASLKGKGGSGLFRGLESLAYFLLKHRHEYKYTAEGNKFYNENLKNKLVSKIIDISRSKALLADKNNKYKQLMKTFITDFVNFSLPFYLLKDIRVIITALNQCSYEAEKIDATVQYFVVLRCLGAWISRNLSEKEQPHLNLIMLILNKTMQNSSVFLTLSSSTVESKRMSKTPIEKEGDLSWSSNELRDFGKLLGDFFSKICGVVKVNFNIKTSELGNSIQYQKSKEEIESEPKNGSSPSGSSGKKNEGNVFGNLDQVRKKIIANQKEKNSEMLWNSQINILSKLGGQPAVFPSYSGLIENINEVVCMLTNDWSPDKAIITDIHNEFVKSRATFAEFEGFNVALQKLMNQLLNYLKANALKEVKIKLGIKFVCDIDPYIMLNYITHADNKADNLLAPFKNHLNLYRTNQNAEILQILQEIDNGVPASEQNLKSNQINMNN